MCMAKTNIHKHKVNFILLSLNLLWFVSFLYTISVISEVSLGFES